MMARIRTIKPEFWTDERVVEMDFWIRLLFIGLWNFADDEGRMVCSERRIKMQIFPADSPNIRGGLNELSRVGLIELYVVDGTEYLQIPTFLKHQRVDHPRKSKLPPKPVPTGGNSPNVRRTLAPEGKGREGKETTPATSRESQADSAQPPAGAVPADAGQVNPEPPDPRASADPALVAMVDSLRVTPGVGTDDHEAAGALWAILAANSVRGTAQHPQVIEWARMGVTTSTLRRAISEARKANEGPLNPAYLAPIVERILAGGDKPKAGQAWATDERACEAKARELGLWPARAGESWDGLRNRIRAALTKRAEEATR